ncbi:MAG: hypothetical protein JETCAE01_33310 [Anaerolineaceae bacterium]|nr:MAG: hypothetical protein JETCAE01_33310 [Anaerolineaceae bacterium]
MAGDDIFRWNYLGGKNGIGSELLEIGCVGGYAGALCSGGKRWDQPCDDIAKWDDVDWKGDFSERVVFDCMV